MFNMRRRAPVSAADLQRRQVALGLVPASPAEEPTPAVEEAHTPEIDADIGIEPVVTPAPACELRIVAEPPVPVSVPAPAEEEEEEEWYEWRGPVERVQEAPGCAVGSVLGCGMGRDHHCFWIWYGRIGRFVCRKCEPGRWAAIPKAAVNALGG